MNRNSLIRPTGIIKTMPRDFVFKEYGARRFVRDFYYLLNEKYLRYFLFTISAIPKIDVIHFYLVIDGCIRYRANIMQFDGEGTKYFYDGRTIHGKAWVYVTGPVVKPPYKIEMKGFRGFRYTEDLW